MARRVHAMRRGEPLMSAIDSRIAFTALIAAVALERAAELSVSRSNTRWSLANGGREHGAAHYPLMVALHAALLVGSVAEVWLADRNASPVLTCTCLAFVAASQALRWWCIATLGRRWSTRV